MVNLYDNPTAKRVAAARSSITNKLKLQPDETFLIAYAIAGHGMSMDGRQVVLINHYDSGTSWYKIWGIESDIRRLAAKNSHAYFLSIFASCREIFTNRHRGLFKGTEQQALVHFDAVAFDELLA